jgi:alkanesulfonate monooxygenase SsuD/methylene tetrahydromethanopterin reductase-like flavin-dependent oxidoreductase (luciferase family)
MILSALDILSPVHMPRLARHLDALGYHRLWATEHHSPSQSASPTLVACLAAAMTSRMRIGTAGVLLKYACPAKVAEDFRLLELYFGGRIDLGIAGGSIAHEELYLDGKPRPDPASYAARVRTLVELVRGDRVGPAVATRPELWLCGSSPSSGALAGELGMSFACNQRGGPLTMRAAIAAYHDAYRGDGAPYVALAMYGSCAATEVAAQRHWGSEGGVPSFAGSPRACVEQIETLVATCGADEAVVHLHIQDIEARLEGFRLLAEAAGLASEPDEVFQELDEGLCEELDHGPADAMDLGLNDDGLKEALN